MIWLIGLNVLLDIRINPIFPKNRLQVRSFDSTFLYPLEFKQRHTHFPFRSIDFTEMESYDLTNSHYLLFLCWHFPGSCLPTRLLPFRLSLWFSTPPFKTPPHTLSPPRPLERNFRLTIGYDFWPTRPIPFVGFRALSVCPGPHIRCRRRQDFPTLWVWRSSLVRVLRSGQEQGGRS